MLPIVLFRSRFMLLRVFVFALVGLFAFFIGHTPTARAQIPPDSEPLPDGDILLLLRQDSEWGAYIMSEDGSNQRPVTKQLNFPRSYINVYAAVLSPDRTQIILALVKTDRTTYQREHRLYRVNSDGNGLKLLWHGMADYLNPSWSPTGDQIGLTILDETSGEHIYVINSDGSGLKRLTAEEDHSTDYVTWSPDGKTILFVSQKEGRYALSMINADGTNLRELLPAHHYFAWSPDGQHIAVALPDEGNLYLINPDGSGLKQLTQMGQVSDLVWSPDGESIAFLSVQSGHQNLYRINADGDELTQLTDTEGKDFVCLKWLPNGKQLNVIMFEHPLMHSPQENIHLVSADGSGVMTALTDDTTTELIGDCLLAVFG